MSVLQLQLISGLPVSFPSARSLIPLLITLIKMAFPPSTLNGSLYFAFKDQLSHSLSTVSVNYIGFFGKVLYYYRCTLYPPPPFFK